MKKHLNIKVYGSVQGVGYRYTAKELADKLNLVGFTRNIPNGSVYIEIEGEEEEVDKFLEWCKDGSSSAAVERVEANETGLKDFPNFLVLGSLSRS